MWECAEINKHRLNTDLSDTIIKALPKAIANGVPLAMVIGCDGAFWDGTKASAVLDSNNHSIFGKVVKLEHQPDNVKGYVKTSMEDLGMGEYKPQLNAHKVCAALKNDIGKVIMPTPYRCTRKVPPEVNAYSDGSWLNGTNRHYSFGGAGIWWPGRAIKKEDADKYGLRHIPLSPAEEELALYEQEPKGVSLYASIGGFSGSSTRSELAAGIIAACANGPVFLASDSEVFVTGAAKIMDDINEGIPISRNWKLVSDGDLWEHLCKALMAKGPHSFKVKWVKGHATDAHIQAGVISAPDRDGNHKADANANMGNQLHGEGTLTVMSALTERFKNYVNFMHKVAFHIIESYLIHRTLVNYSERVKAKREAGIDNTVPYQALSYPAHDQTSRLLPVASMHCYSNLNKDQPAALNIERFLANVDVTRDPAMHRCITWLELYVLYRLRGGAKVIPDPQTPAHPRGTADKQIRAFKNTVRTVAERTLDPEGDGKLFKPGKAEFNNLKGVGILGRSATLLFNVYVNEHERECIALALSSLIRGGSVKTHKRFLKGEINLLPHELKLKGKAAWDSNLSTMAIKPTLQGDWASLSAEGFNQHTGATMLGCPGCGGLESSHVSSFQRYDLDRRHKCGFCRKLNPVRKWRCPCLKPWHVCSTHAGCFKPRAGGEEEQLLIGRLSSGSNDLKPDGSRKWKTPEDVIAADHRKVKALKIAQQGIKRKADITFDVERCFKKPTCLGPVLSERFSGVLERSLPR